MYSDIIVGAGANKHEAFVYAKPVIGLYAYTKLNNKLAINLSRAYNQYGSNEPIDTASLSLHQYGFENIVLDFEVNIQKVANEYESTVSFMLGSRFWRVLLESWVWRTEVAFKVNFYVREQATRYAWNVFVKVVSGAF